jgi:acyl carrier protein
LTIFEPIRIDGKKDPFNRNIMKKAEFYLKIREALEMDEKTVNDQTPVHLTSLRTLTLIAFVDENFSKQIKIVNLKEVKTITDLMGVIGKDNFTD